MDHGSDGQARVPILEIADMPAPPLADALLQVAATVFE
jgi:hypothetical protein